MPASVAAPITISTMPLVLCAAFQQSRLIATDQNTYVDASQQSNVFAATSRKKWSQTARILGPALITLRNFYVLHTGGTVDPSFFFYDLYEASPMADVGLYDPTGASINGRFTCRFISSYSQALDLGRNQAQFQLIEVG